jgi:phosphotransferase system  glucose/maltose/N-acetylglucosamine-specific IIC component
LEGAPIDGIIGVMTEQPEPYKWRTRIRSIASVVVGATTAFFPVAVAWRLDRNLSLTAMLAVYVGSAVLLSFAWRLYFDRPKELEKQIPINSKEHRHRKKEFYDWLDSQGRR